MVEPIHIAECPASMVASRAPQAMRKASTNQVMVTALSMSATVTLPLRSESARDVGGGKSVYGGTFGHLLEYRRALDLAQLPELAMGKDLHAGANCAVWFRVHVWE